MLVRIKNRLVFSRNTTACCVPTSLFLYLVLPHLFSAAVTCFATTKYITVIVFKLHSFLLIKLHIAECRRLGL